MRKRYQKLVRDRIPEIVARDGQRAKTRKLGVPEFKKELLKKLLEESKEAHDAKGKKELVKELGDVLEVIFALYSAYGLEPKEVERIRKTRKRERGGFEKKIFLEYID